MKRWAKEVIYIEYQKRYVECVMEGKKIISECETLHPDFVDHLISCHNDSISDTYEEGVKNGVEIAKGVYRDGE